MRTLRGRGHTATLGASGGRRRRRRPSLTTGRRQIRGHMSNRGSPAQRRACLTLARTLKVSAAVHVWGACKAVGVAKESIPLSPRAKAQRQADSEVFSMGAIPERLWFDRECERSRVEVRRAERSLRSLLRRGGEKPGNGQPGHGVNGSSSSRGGDRQGSCRCGDASSSIVVGSVEMRVLQSCRRHAEGRGDARERYIESLRKYRALRRKKEVAYRSSLRILI